MKQDDVPNKHEDGESTPLMCGTGHPNTGEAGCKRDAFAVGASSPPVLPSTQEEQALRHQPMGQPTISASAEHRNEKGMLTRDPFNTGASSPPAEGGTDQHSTPIRVNAVARERSTAPLQNWLLTVKEVAALTRLSERTVYRFADAGRMPRQLKLGGAVRWRGKDIEAWIDGGCKPVRKTQSERRSGGQ